MVRIFYNDTFLDVYAEDSSYRLIQIMGDNLVSLNFKLTEFVDFPVGSRINHQGQEFETYDVCTFTKQNDRLYTYSMTFHGKQRVLDRYKFRNHVDRRLKFTLTAKPREFLEHIVINLNEREQGGDLWRVDDCIDTTEKTLSFSHNSIREALNSIAQTFETEWRIEGKTISLRKLEYNKETPLELAYGMGNGFKSGITRQVGSDSVVDVLYAEGGDRNIDQSKYTYTKVIEGVEQTLHADTLRLPRNEKFVYLPPNIPISEAVKSKDNGNVYRLSDVLAMEEDERKRILEQSQFYFSDADGFSLTRGRLEYNEIIPYFINNGYEDSLDLTAIYPMREGVVTDVTNSDPEKHFWEFEDNTLADEQPPIDYSDNQKIERGEKVTCIFQSGMLTGKEFDISAYYPKGNTKGKKPYWFDLVPQEIDGIIMPDYQSGYYPRPKSDTYEGDKYAIFHCELPQAYIVNAEMKMALEACHYMWLHSEVEVEFKGSLDGIWARKNWDDVYPRIGLGYYVRFTDSAICKEGKLMRIVAIKDSINRPHSPEITLSNTSISQGISTTLKKIATNEAYVESLINYQASYTKRNFRDSKEAMESVSNYVTNLEQYQFSESVNPATINTMMMLVGDENLQYRFGDVTMDARRLVTEWARVTYTPTWEDGTLKCSETYMRHEAYTSNYGVMTSSTAKASYPYWHIDAYENIPDNPSLAYYLYIVAPMDALSHFGYCVTEARFLLSHDIIGNTDDTLYLLVGILNSEFDGMRSFATMYGRSEINGGNISTDIIKSNDGNMFIDLINGIIQGKFNFLSGLISSSILLGSSEGTATAGISGEGDKRFWSGGSIDNPNFYVTADGELVLIKPQVSKVVINKDGMKIYTWQQIDKAGNENYYLKFEINNLGELTSSPNWLDGFMGGGQTIRIDNMSGLSVFGAYRQTNINQGIIESDYVKAREFDGYYHKRISYVDSNKTTHYLDYYRFGFFVHISGQISARDFYNDKNFFPLNEGWKPVASVIGQAMWGDGKDDDRAFTINPMGVVVRDNIGDVYVPISVSYFTANAYPTDAEFKEYI